MLIDSKILAIISLILYIITGIKNFCITAILILFIDVKIKLNFIKKDNENDI